VDRDSRSPTRIVPRSTALVALAVGQLLTTPPLQAGGFAIPEQGSKATGLAAAFAGLADDPTAVFHNPGGTAFFDGPAAAGGLTVMAVDQSLYQGRAPGIAAGENGSQEPGMDLLPHAFYVQPLSPVAVLGVGAYSPFQLTTQWADGDTFPGRQVALATDLSSLDLATTVGLRVSPSWGVGIGAVVRASELSLLRRLVRFNPLDRRFQDVASFALETDMEVGVGWTAGVLHRPSDRFSWGLSYKSGIDLEYGGSGTLTQIETGNPQFDDLTRASLPLDQELPFTTRIEFPATASLGLAIGLSEQWALTLQGDWTGWSRLQSLALVFPNDPSLSDEIPEGLDDTVAVRAGLLYKNPGGFELRLGAAYDPSPQPVENVGPLWVDGDRTVVSAGIGLDWLDVSLSWQQLDDRLITGQVDGFDGLYRDSRYTVVVSVSP
jgi:long-chain fatty acid transport protein